jgi:hypothetical protein
MKFIGQQWAMKGIWSYITETTFQTERNISAGFVNSVFIYSIWFHKCLRSNQSFLRKINSKPNITKTKKIFIFNFNVLLNKIRNFVTQNSRFKNVVPKITIFCLSGQILRKLNIVKPNGWMKCNILRKRSYHVKELSITNCSTDQKWPSK